MPRMGIMPGGGIPIIPGGGMSIMSCGGIPIIPGGGMSIMSGGGIPYLRRNMSSTIPGGGGISIISGGGIPRLPRLMPGIISGGGGPNMLCLRRERPWGPMPFGSKSQYGLIHIVFCGLDGWSIFD